MKKVSLLSLTGTRPSTLLSELWPEYVPAEPPCSGVRQCTTEKTLPGCRFQSTSGVPAGSPAGNPKAPAVQSNTTIVRHGVFIRAILHVLEAPCLGFLSGEALMPTCTATLALGNPWPLGSSTAIRSRARNLKPRKFCEPYGTVPTGRNVSPVSPQTNMQHAMRHRIDLLTVRVQEDNLPRSEARSP